jgi:diadenylate cyclase
MINEVLDYLSRLLRTFTWKDGLEIALIAAVVYLVYRSLRGTRGARVVRGFIFVLVTSFVVVRLLGAFLHMERLEFLYTKLVPAMILLAVILFQPELRRSLMRLGQNPLFRMFLKEGAFAFVDRIVRSAATLSRNKVGAIIAVERETRLASLIESGILIDAELTSEMLTTIFWPGSPLHDMGVVIRSGRIAAAGCEFPLARESVLDPQLGTRHRAAIGLTEETDAVVIVVSEETGNISLAEGGNLESPLTPDALRDRLTELLSGPGATLTEHSLETPAEPAAPEPNGEKPTDPGAS